MKHHTKDLGDRAAAIATQRADRCWKPGLHGGYEALWLALYHQILRELAFQIHRRRLEESRHPQRAKTPHSSFWWGLLFYTKAGNPSISFLIFTQSRVLNLSNSGSCLLQQQKIAIQAVFWQNKDMKKLYKSRENKVFAGVIGGIGEYYNVDPVILRLGWLVILFFTGLFPGILLYVISIFVVPHKSEQSKLYAQTWPSQVLPKPGLVLRIIDIIVYNVYTVGI